MSAPSCSSPTSSPQATEKPKPASTKKHHQDIVWMDLEMTGLDPQKDQILEIATLITDFQLNVIATGPELVLHQPLETLEAMDPWNREHHRGSGLWDRALASNITAPEAEQLTLDFLTAHTAENKHPLAGNSIWQDRRFLVRYMPRIHTHLHYRLIDVSTIKELAKRWYPEIKTPAKKNHHRAMDDIRESIEELQFWRTSLFRPQNRAAST